jgi:integrase
MSSAWVFQDSRQAKKLGPKACPWSVGFIDPEGRRRSKRIGTKTQAQTFAQRVAGQIAAGVYERESRTTWADFRKEYTSRVVVGLAAGTQVCIIDALDAFERIVRPARVDAIRTATIDSFIAQRRTERGRKPGSTVSPSSINKQLRYLRAAFAKAVRWGYLRTAPEITMQREPARLIRFVTPEHFAQIYAAADAAKLPAPNAGDWWRAMVVFLYLGGWRVGEALALRCEDLEIDAVHGTGRAITRSDDNKGKRSESVPLHPLVVEYLAGLVGVVGDCGGIAPGVVVDREFVFSWPASRRDLWTEFARIQDAAGIKLQCHESHEHTDACFRYGFHDLRRAFATTQAGSLTANELQTMMRHRSFSTTKKYIAMAKDASETVAKLIVPEPVGRALGK